MDSVHPLRGADAVNNELEVGYDEAFERRWRVAEVVGRFVMVLFVAAGLAGLFGQGPFSHRTHETPDKRLSVDFEPVARHDTSTQVTLHLSADPASENGPGQTAQTRVFVSSMLAEPMGLQYVVPQPASTKTEADGIVYTFNLPPGRETALVRFMLKPSAYGPVEIRARQGNDHLSWTQVVLP